EAATTAGNIRKNRCSTFMDMTMDSAGASSFNDSSVPSVPSVVDLHHRGNGGDGVIKAIGFDLWETLITNPHDVTHAHKSLRLERLSRILSTTPDAIESAYAYVWTRCQELYWSADKDVPCRT